MSVSTLLLEDGKITNEQLAIAEEAMKSSEMDLEDILVQLKYIDKQTMADYVIKEMLG